MAMAGNADINFLSHRRRPVPIAEMGPGLPRGTSPWAEGPREDRSSRV